MAVKSYGFVASLWILICLCTSASAGDEYWICYRVVLPGTEHPGGGAKYLLKLDALGNVLVPPTKVVPNSGFTAGAAISQDSFGRLNLWLSRVSKNVYRALVNEKTLKLGAIKKTGATTSDFEYISVTQKAQNNFLLTSRMVNPAEHLYWAQAISPSGTVLPENWQLSQNPSCANLGCIAGFSSDGKLFFFTEHERRGEKFVLQRLGPRGRPTGNPVVVEEQRFLMPFDVTNLLLGGIRYVLYFSASSSIGPGSLFLQAINSKTLRKVGDRVKIPSVATFLAADPQGRFVVYSSGTLHPYLYFQALDATGHPSGLPKILANNVVDGGVDILKVRNQ